MAARGGLAGAAVAAAVWAGAAGLAPGTGAAAGTVSAAEPETLVAALEAAGFAGRLGRTRLGDPLIHAATPGALPFHVRFYGCREGRDCRSVQLVAAFAARGVAPERVNLWNAAMRFGRLHVTEGGQPVLSLDIALEPGGLPEAHVAAQLAIWEQLMETVRDLVAGQ